MDQTQSFALPLHSPSLQPPSQAHTHHQQPPQQPQHQGPVPYNADFADALAARLLAPASPAHAAAHQSSTSTSATASAPSPLQIPLPLDSPLRQHPSHLHPALQLTHAHGALVGGPCTTAPPALRAHAQDIVELNGLGSKEELAAYLLREIGRRGGEMETRLRERQRGKEANERVALRLQALEDERRIDLKQQERWRKERERRGR